MSNSHDSSRKAGEDAVRSTPATAVVFVDYQNMYRSARRAFDWERAPGHFGNLKPIGLGRVLAPSPQRTLTQVRVYSGVPTPKHNRVGNAVMQRRIAQWVMDNPKIVQVFPRPLRYPPPEGREKGVDVELAIDLVRMAIDGDFEAAVVASADTDLLPAIEFVVKRFPDLEIETVAFRPEKGCEGVTAAPLDIRGGGLAKRHRIDKATFERAISDKRNYVTATSRARVERSRWEKITRRLGG